MPTWVWRDARSIFFSLSTPQICYRTKLLHSDTGMMRTRRQGALRHGWPLSTWRVHYPSPVSFHACRHAGIHNDRVTSSNQCVNHRHSAACWARSREISAMHTRGTTQKHWPIPLEAGTGPAGPGSADACGLQAPCGHVAVNRNLLSTAGGWGWWISWLKRQELWQRPSLRTG